MRIVQVVHAFPPETRGGTEAAVEALARAMQADGHDVTIVSGSLREGRSDVVDEGEHEGLRVLRLHRDDLYYESWWKAWSPLVSVAWARLLRRLRPDVVHVHHWLRLTTDLVRLARAAGCRTALTVHDTFAVLARPARLAGERGAEPPPVPAHVCRAEATAAFALHRRDLRADVAAAHVRLSPSRAHAAALTALADGDLGSFTVQPPPLLARPRRAPAPATRGRRLVTWGSLYPQKGVMTLLAALRQAGPGWSLQVFGQAHDRGHEAELARAADGLDVRFHGAFTVHDLERVVADYAVLPTRCEESYGLVLDEAACLGWPVLASDVAAFRERASPSVAFFPPGDAAALASLLRDEPRLAALPPPAPAIALASSGAGQRSRELLQLYAGDADASLPMERAGAAELEQARVAALFRRAERRGWTALQQPSPPPPPDEFMAE